MPSAVSIYISRSPPMPSAISIHTPRSGGRSHIPLMFSDALSSFNLHLPPQPHILNFQINTTISYTHLHFLHASLAQQSTPAVPTTRSSRHSQFTTRSSCNLILPLAHRDWQRSPRSGAVAAAFTKLKIQWMYIIKTCSLTVSYNVTTDIGIDIIMR